MNIAEKVIDRISVDFGSTKTDIANKLKTKPQTLTNWCRRGSIPGPRLFQLRDIYGVSPEFVKTGSGSFYVKENKMVVISELMGDVIAYGNKSFHGLPFLSDSDYCANIENKWCFIKTTDTIYPGKKYIICIEDGQRIVVDVLMIDKYKVFGKSNSIEIGINKKRIAEIYLITGTINI